ncbi:MAG: hypothetical protein P1U56_17600 [Saprospiraceae bacterium]|nr:hypothetical protein [Saprospiraceae bacterium]
MNFNKKINLAILLCFTLLIAIMSSCSNRTETNLDTDQNSAKTPLPAEKEDQNVIPEKFKPLFGVNAGPGAFWPDTEGPSYGFKDVTQQYQDIGVNIIRVSDFFGAGDMMNYFPYDGSGDIPDPIDPKNYYWAETDKQVAKIKDGDFDIHLRLGQSWRNMASWAPYKGMPLEGYQLNPDNPVNFWPNIAQISKEVQPQLFIEFLDHFLKQWDLSANKKIHVEFWNEPNIQSINTVPSDVSPHISDEEFLNTTFTNYEWDGTPLEFYQLFETCAKAIKNRYPNIKIGGPAIWNPLGGEGPIDKDNPFPFNQRWIKLFFDYVQANEVPMDFICWNVYSDHPEDYEKNYVHIQEHLDRIGYTETQQMITEYAIRFDNKTTLSDGLEVSNTLIAKGASIATSLWIGFQKLPNLHMTYYNRGSDGPYIPGGAGFPIMVKEDSTGIVNSSPNSFGTAGIGLLNGDGTYKPLAHAHKLWNEMADLIPVDPDKYLTYKVPYQANMHVLAGENPQGQVIILGAFRNDFSNMKATLNIEDTVKRAIVKTVMDDGVDIKEIVDSKALKNIWIQPNRAFQITLFFEE